MNEGARERRNAAVRDRRSPVLRDRRAASAAIAGLDDKVNPVAEEAYWRANYTGEPYYRSRYSFDDYYPAYRAGWEGRARHPGLSFADVEHDLEADFNWNRGNSMLDWDTARDAVRAAWNRASA